MRIRTQLMLALTIAAVLGAAMFFVVARSVASEERAGRVQARAQLAAHEVTGLLVLTQEYARHFEARAAAQWRARLATLQTALTEQQAEPAAPHPALKELSSAASALPALFDRLVSLAATDDEFGRRRRDVLLDQLLTNAQAMSDYAYQWHSDAIAARDAEDQALRRIALIAPSGLLAIVILIAWMFHARVLGPLDRLAHATTAITRGELDARIASTAADELGLLSRHFDAMADSLAQRSEQLRASEKLLRATTDNLPVLIAYVDAGQRYRFCNARYREVFGVEPAALIGQRIEDLVGAATYAQHVQAQVEAALRGEHQRFDRHVAEGPLKGHSQVEYVPDRGADGTINGFYAITFDITARKEAELALARSEEKFRDILRNAPDAFVGIDARGAICEWNEQAERIFGWRRTEVLGRELSGVLIPLRMREAHRAGFKRFMQSGRGPMLEKRVEVTALCRDEREIEIELSVAAARDEQGRPTANAFLRDITERRRAREEVERRERLLRDITDNLPAMVGYFDRDERCIFANSAALRIEGKSVDDIARSTLRDGIGDDNYALHKPYVDKALAGERCSFEGHVVRDGRENYYQAYLVPDRAADGTVGGFYLMTFDVTARKTVERKLVEFARADTLTGLPNRLKFNEALDEALARRRRSGAALALMFLDVDHFKLINDTLGHAAGDAVLIEVAKRLRASVRQTDLVARLAGDEFVVLLEGLHDRAEASAIAAKIVTTVRDPLLLEGQLRGVTTSVGVAYRDAGPDVEIASDEMLAQADQALYQVKRAGRDGFRII